MEMSPAARFKSSCDAFRAIATTGRDMVHNCAPDTAVSISRIDNGALYIPTR
ncbi:UNVERIFIED_ORG: hypothetical protein QE446_005120 [Rhizobium sp. SORGH_AS260]|nr:hypothetical protein [Rhizobium sp. SORGH_AS_0285]MDP9757196.1 hypothetical protein [Rhizobium sp. SORGH_AS_0260]MDR6084065.1 hypothetical protein [Agrobacterium sp. SORGH_AS_0440]